MLLKPATKPTHIHNAKFFHRVVSPERDGKAMQHLHLILAFRCIGDFKISFDEGIVCELFNLGKNHPTRGNRTQRKDLMHGVCTINRLIQSKPLFFHFIVKLKQVRVARFATGIHFVMSA